MVFLLQQSAKYLHSTISRPTFYAKLSNRSILFQIAQGLGKQCKVRSLAVSISELVSRSESWFCPNSGRKVWNLTCSRCMSHVTSVFPKPFHSVYILICQRHIRHTIKFRVTKSGYESMHGHKYISTWKSLPCKSASINGEGQVGGPATRHGGAWRGAPTHFQPRH